MLDYYLPMLSSNEGYNETGLTQQSAGPIRELMQEIRLMYLYKGSEFGHWRVTAGWDAFAFRHPSLGQTVKTRERRGSSFSQLGLEPNHTGLTAQSLFFLEESCRVKRSDTQTFSNFSNYFKRVLKLQKRSSSFSK